MSKYGKTFSVESRGWVYEYHVRSFLLLWIFEILHLKRFLENENKPSITSHRWKSKFLYMAHKLLLRLASADALSMCGPSPQAPELQVYQTTSKSPQDQGLTLWCQCSGMASAYINSTKLLSLWTYKGDNTQLRCPLHWKYPPTLEILPGFPRCLEQTPTATLQVAMVYLPPPLTYLSRSSSKVGPGLTHLSTPCLALCCDTASTEESLKLPQRKGNRQKLVQAQMYSVLFLSYSCTTPIHCTYADSKFN